MVQITNVVVQTDLHTRVDLVQLANNMWGIRYDPALFTGAIWKHKKIGGCCLVFHNGKLICNGNKSIQQAKKRTRQYARLIQKLGHEVNLKRIQLITITTVHQLSSTLDFKKLCSILGGTYDPDIHNAAMLKRGRVHYNCFQSGKVVMTGVRSVQNLYATILELELCTT